MILNIQKRSVACWYVTIESLPLEFITEEMVHELKSVISNLKKNKKVKVVIFECAVYDFFISQIALLRDAALINEHSTEYFFMCPELSSFIRNVPFITIGIKRDKTQTAGNDFLQSLDFCFIENKVIHDNTKPLKCNSSVRLGTASNLMNARLESSSTSKLSERIFAKIIEDYKCISRTPFTKESDMFINWFANKLSGYSKEAITILKKEITKESAVAYSNCINELKEKIH
jgi:hypothetical protein